MDPWPLDVGPRPKSGKSRLNLHGTILKGNSIGLNQKNKLKRARKESLRFEEPRYKLGFNSRIQFASNDTKLVLDSGC